MVLAYKCKIDATSLKKLHWHSFLFPKFQMTTSELSYKLQKYSVLSKNWTSEIW